MVDGKKTGDINVQMGDGNTVGQIGHNITFHAPPPSPNAVWQNGRVIGEIASNPAQEGDRLIFSKIFLNADFNDSLPIKVQGFEMLLEGFDASYRVAFGPVDSTTLRNAKFKLIGKA